ncbi:MAG: type II toxin-antitoxin system ParD family antitoxin [Sphingomonadales bacterium]|nr:type II toxin-antitoxin system ParD family antitoxin [Sphingomonadales bacterium]
MAQTRSEKPVTVTLGKLTDAAQARVASGRYSSLSEVLRAGLRALDREEAMLDAYSEQRIRKALAEPRAGKPLDEGIASVRRRLEEKWSADDA